MPDSKLPTPPNPLHPQAKSLGKNRLNNPKKGADTVSSQPATPNTPTVAAASAPPASPATASAPPASPATASAPNRAPVPVAPSPAPKPVAAPPVPKDPAPGKDKSYFELTIKLHVHEGAPFVVEVPLTGNGANDKANAISVARKKFPGHAMSIISSRIYTKSENALTEIAPGSTLSALFGASGEITSDLIEIGRAFYDGSRGTIFLRNLRTHVGVTFRPASGGLAVFSNRIVSNRLASELPLIVAEVLGNNAREIQIYLK